MERVETFVAAATGETPVPLRCPVPLIGLVPLLSAVLPFDPLPLCRPAPFLPERCRQLDHPNKVFVPVGRRLRCQRLRGTPPQRFPSP
jgi:hypothetical protein